MKFPNKYEIIFTDKKYKVYKRNSITVPLLFSLPLIFYLKKKGILSKILKNNFELSNKFKFQIRNKKIVFILNKRSKLISDNIKLLLKNNIYKGMYKLGWYLNKNEK